MSVEAAARYLGVSAWMVRQLLIAGEIPLTRLPRPRTASARRQGARRPVEDVMRLTLIDRLALDEWIDTRCTRERLAVGVFPHKEGSR